MNPTKEYTLEQLGTFEKTYSFSRALEGDGEYRHIHYGDIHTKLPYIIQKSEVLPTITENQNFETVKYGDILIADASEDYKDLGKSVCFLDSIDTKVISGLHTHRFSPNTSLVKPEYLINLFQTNRYRKFVWKMGTGVSVLGLSKTNLAKYTVTIPSLAKQEDIANHFLNLNKKIKLQKEKIDLLKEQKKGYMQKIFSQELRFKDSNNNEFPKWKTYSLLEIANFRRGSFPQPYGEPKWYDAFNGMPFVQVVDVADNMKLQKNTKNKISNLAKNYSVFAPKGTLVVTLQGSIGRVAKTQYDAYIDRTLLVFVDYNVAINIDYFKYVIQEIFYIEKQKAPGGTIKTITKEVLSSFKTDLPCIEEQNKIADLLVNIENKLELELAKLEVLNQQKQAFMQQMFI